MPPMRWLLLVLALPLGSRLAAADKPVPVNEAAARMTAPEGFRVTLFAGEPDVVQPIAFTFDDRGRMWVVECVTYPKWVQPGQKGKDRVVILEDTDGDGRHDKRTVVLDDGVNLSGIELGFGGVYLCSTPNLIFVPIKDDRPAGPPEVLLDGWNLKDAKHNVFNGLGWGPDGWLYGCNGIQTKSWVGRPGTPQDKRTYLDCGVWRFHPTRKAFEVVATGTTNPWGLDWDEYGEMFITNCVIDHLWHVVPGGRYQRMFGQDPNPYAFGLMGPASDHRHWAGGHWTDSRADRKTGAVQKGHDDAGGGHAHSGCAIYLGDNFPPEYRNSVFMCNIHGSRLNRDSLHRTDRGYVGKHEKDFLFANDPWFRGICVKQGPEGALYVSDWTDTSECHNYDVADVSNGRIYRVSYGTPKPFRGDVAAMPDAELAQAQLSGNEWLVRHARRVLQERAAAGRPAAKAADELLWRESIRDVRAHLRKFWALHVTGGLDSAGYAAQMGSLSEQERAWAVRLAADAPGGLTGPAADQLPRLAATQESPLVRRAIASAIHRLPSDQRVRCAARLLARPANDDPDTALIAWYAVQPIVLADPAAGRELLAHCRARTVRTNIVRLLLSLPNGNPAGQLEQLLPVLAAAQPPTRADILAGILQAFADRPRVTPPAGWKDAYAELVTGQPESVADLLDEVALKFGDPRAVAALTATAGNDKLPAARRQQAIERLAPLKPSGFADALKRWLADPAVRGAAVRALAAYPDADIPAAILKAYPAFTAAEKADAVQTLAARKEFAAALLDAVADGRVPKADVTAFTARQILALNDKPLADRLAAVWGTVQPASATRAAQTRRLKGLLAPDAVAAADPVKGKAIYSRTCAACHKLFGEGGDVGPELTGSQRASLDYLLENVLDPNAVVPFDYKMTAFYLSDGRVVTGLVKGETPRAVTVRTATEQLVIPTADIEGRKPTNNSVMPEGLLDPLSDAELRDLFAYLMAKGAR
jgi:putative membrane-bound dehydrogenase-like protein